MFGRACQLPLLSASISSSATLQYSRRRGCGQSPCKVKCVALKLLVPSFAHSALELWVSQKPGSQLSDNTNWVSFSVEMSLGDSEPCEPGFSSSRNPQSALTQRSGGEAF